MLHDIFATALEWRVVSGGRRVAGKNQHP